MDLTGQWKGKYSYGRGYSKQMQGTSDEFVINIIDRDGNFTGTCVDSVVNTIEGNISTIEGTFKDNFISFIKKYKYRPYIESSTGASKYRLINSGDIHYTGNLSKRLLTRKCYFKGEWVLTSEFQNLETGELTYSTGNGGWTMEKIGI